MNKLRSESAAWGLHRRVLPEIHRQWPDHRPSVREMFDPAIGAHVLGIAYQDDRGLGRTSDGRHQYDIAGVLDRPNRTISVSSALPADVMRFTGAHELGHWLLHPHETLHRDRPVPGLSVDSKPRPPIEAEADHFAASYLMQERLIRAFFESAFRTKGPFILDDDTSFLLQPGASTKSTARIVTAFGLARTLATATSYAATPFRSLHDIFGVSAQTMAIRLLELNLVSESLAPSLESGTGAPSVGYRPLFPPGLHSVTENDLVRLFADPFAKRERRLELIASLQYLLQFLRQIPLECNIWLDGSFTTDNASPGDIDVVVFIQPGQIDHFSREQRQKVQLLQRRDLLQTFWDLDLYVDPLGTPDREQYWKLKFEQGRLAEAHKGIPYLSISCE